MAAPRIAVVGSTMIDLVAYAPRAPGAGETIVGDRFQMGFGGKGANQAVMARLLGADVWMVNRVGDDAYGSMIVDNLAGYGVDVEHVVPAEGSSGVAPIWVEPDGTNRIIIVPGANHLLSPDDAVAALTSIGHIDVVVGQFEIPQPVTLAAFRAAREMGAATILNPAPAAPPDAALLEVSDWIVPNEVEFAGMFGDEPDDRALLAASERIPGRLVVTLGAEGCAVAGDPVVRLPAPRVDTVDTTGAGDAFVGGLAYGRAAGLEELDALRLATLCGSESVAAPGTQSSFPSGERARALLASVTG